MSEMSDNVVTRLNYQRPEFFGGLFGHPSKYNTSTGCTFPPHMTALITPQELNQLVKPIYKIRPVLAYHVMIMLLLLWSASRPIFNAFVQALSQHSEITYQNYLNSMAFVGIMDILWYIGVVVIFILYYVTIQKIESFFLNGHEQFRKKGIIIRVLKKRPSRYIFIEGFKKIDALEFHRA